MEPRTVLDPMFQPDRRSWCGPIAVVGMAAVMLALHGMALRAGPIVGRRPAPSPWRIPPGAAAAPIAPRRPPADRFVIAAPAWVDPAMVVHAPEDIDPEMVFHPETGRRGGDPGTATWFRPR